MTSSEKKQLQIAACKVRMGVIESTHGAKAGHPGGSLSAAEVFTYLYFKEMNIDPANPRWEDRDRFVLSKGHTVPGVDMSTGSLGQGVSAAVGMAMAAKYQGKTNRVYSLLGDGEVQEGQVWEACMAAAHYKLDNLCIVIDNNGLQIDGNIADVMSPYPIVDKLLAFGFNVHAVDGHDFDALEKAFENAKKTKGQPTAIVMSTVKGKGVSYMENNAGWHGKAPNDAEYEQAMTELKAQLAEVEGK